MVTNMWALWALWSLFLLQRVDHFLGEQLLEGSAHARRRAGTMTRATRTGTMTRANRIGTMTHTTRVGTMTWDGTLRGYKIPYKRVHSKNLSVCSQTSTHSSTIGKKINTK